MSTTKEYPLLVEDIPEFEASDHPIFYRSKGHHDPEKFIKAIYEYAEDQTDWWKLEHYPPPTFRVEEVIHTYQRNIGVPGMKGVTTIWDTTGPAKGAYPVTMVYC